MGIDISREKTGVENSDIFPLAFPNLAKAEIVAPTMTANELHQNLFQMGLTAADLKPIDWRNSNLLPPKNQGNCGDCWAMSSTSAFTDRFRIHKNLDNLDLEPAITAQCVPDTLNNGCMGGYPSKAGEYFENVGLVDSSGKCPGWDAICTPANNCGPGITKTPTLPTCQDLNNMCVFSDSKEYKAIQGSTKSTAVYNNDGSVNEEQTIISMKQELLNGPYPVTYFVAFDFVSTTLGYKWDITNGIYVNGAYDSDLAAKFPTQTANLKKKGVKWSDIIKEENNPAAHAVEIVGWDIGDAGSYGKIPYWIIKNSWGENWNENGYFRYAMNDYASTGKHNNETLALDIPVKNFGSGTSFQIDVNSGDKPQPSSNKKNYKNWLLWVGIGILVILVVWGVYKFYKYRQEKLNTSSTDSTSLLDSNNPSAPVYNSHNQGYFPN